jgi:hypothetical protein
MASRLRRIGTDMSLYRRYRPNTPDGGVVHLAEAMMTDWEDLRLGGETGKLNWECQEITGAR